MMMDDIFICTCKMCGKEFIASRPNTQFCGKVCYNSYRDFQRKLLRHPVENVDAWRYHMTYFLRLALNHAKDSVCVFALLPSYKWDFMLTMTMQHYGFMGGATRAEKLMVKNMKAAAERLMSLPWNTMTYEVKDVLRQVKNVAYQQKMSFAKKGDHDGNVA